MFVVRKTYKEMKESLKSKLFTHLVEKYPAWVHGGSLERYAMELGFMASNASRRCREMAKSGTIEHRYNERHEVEYRFIPTAEPRPRVQPRLMPLSTKFQ
jgi:hypothetical protein